MRAKGMDVQLTRHDRNRSRERGGSGALLAICLGVLMVVLNATVLNVALPSIRESLRVTDASLVWVLSAYMLAFSGSLLLAGQLADVYGHRRVFLAGAALFATASLMCSGSEGLGVLIAGRVVQGCGGAAVMVSAMSLITGIFSDRAQRAKAMGLYGLVTAGGATLGLLLGGILTSTLDWRAIFLLTGLVNIGVCALGSCLVQAKAKRLRPRHVDVGGAVAMAGTLSLLVRGIENISKYSWSSPRTVMPLAFAALLLGVFASIERNAPTPLINSAIVRSSKFIIANVVYMLWSASMCAWYYMAALYMRSVLGYEPMKIGLAFLPMNVIVAVFGLGLSAKIAMRFGIGKPICVGILLAVPGFLMFARLPLSGNLAPNIFMGMIFIGLAAGIALSPLLLAATSGVASEHSGAASGIANSSSVLGGALGLSIMASVASARTHALAATGTAGLEALGGGYRVAFLGAAFCATCAAILAVAFLLSTGRMSLLGYAVWRTAVRRFIG